ncbi:hypothetical protein B5M09_001975 [Aphanomyces astaci]|uniref:Uncharacterized protein n=1 Tax=Aphanomyces astaci TaxID=112090 RepID=A0A425DLJ7_APHAT|nr:hypothetical protein B5M09_001975 [Aphanomyces astaci]
MPCLAGFGMARNGSDLYEEANKCSPILVRGFSSGNVSVVDKQSWLEVCDTKHRYGANLQAYYKAWKQLTTRPGFWEWLSDESVEVEGVSRTKLERETVLYYDRAEREQFALDIRPDGLLVTRWDQLPITTGDDGWIFVLRDGVLYGSEKVTNHSPRIHHTSLVGGECVQAAGMIVVVDGVLRVMYPHSGHYRPSEHEVLVLLRFLQSHGISLQHMQVDVQRIQKRSRDGADGQKLKKVHNAYFWSGDHVLNFLQVKEQACEANLFHNIERCCDHDRRSTPTGDAST